MITAKPKLEREPQPLQWTPGEFDRMMRLGLLRGRDVSFADGVIYERTPDGKAAPLRWAGEEYYLLGDAGLLDDVRVELVEGVIVEMSPINRPHMSAVLLTAKLLEHAFEPGHFVQTQGPLALGEGGYPEPDVAVIPGSPRDYPDEHPGHAVLVVEVADTSVRYDRSVKAALYARAGIPEYWIVNLKSRQVEVYRLPETSGSHPASYAHPAIYGEADEIAPLARPEARIRVADLLP